MKLIILVLFLIGFSVSSQAMKLDYDPKDPNVSAPKTLASNIEAGSKVHETGQVDTNCPHCNLDRNQDSAKRIAVERAKVKAGGDDGSN